MSEQEYRKRFLLKWQKENPEGRLYRINSGVAWTANKKDTAIKKIGGFLTVLLRKARRFFGAPADSPDLWGYTVKEVSAPCCGSCKHCYYTEKAMSHVCDKRIHSTVDMDWDCSEFENDTNYYEPIKTQKKAIFTWVELKTKKDKITKGQQKKIDQLNAVGGIGKIEREE